MDFNPYKQSNTCHLYYTAEVSVETSIVRVALVLAVIVCTKYAERYVFCHDKFHKPPSLPGVDMVV
jgi:hypothetical protein